MIIRFRNLSSLVVSLGFVFCSSIGAVAQTPAENVNAVIGLGFAGPSDSPDYNLNSNTLSSTHEGKTTPQYMVGLSYPLPINYFKQSDWDNQCTITTADSADVQKAKSTRWRCQPLGAFVSAKFSTDSSSTVNGVTFGLTHRIVGNLSLLIAGSLSPFQQPSPGFINAAVQTVVAQRAANNTFYNLFDPTAMKANAKDAFDGFPTVLITTTGTITAPVYTPGTQIYNGTVLVTNYRPGFMIGVALTPNAIKLLTGGK
jgi:hypothetical protein